MKPTLVFISPTWTPELEELLQVTKESFTLKVLTQKQTIDFQDPYIEILECFETYSPLELGKLIPWLLQIPGAHFHLLLPENATGRQLAGVGAVLSMIRAFPQSYITHSPWPKSNWSFPLWLKAFQNLFDKSITNFGRRTLSLPRPTHASPMAPSIKSIDLLKHLWVFPSQKGPEPEWQQLIQALLNRHENLLEFWNWSHLSIRNQNKIRQRFASYWAQFRSHQPRDKFEDWTGVQFLILVGGIELPFSESDLLDLAINFGINIVMDSSTRRRLQGPWKDGDTFWLWHPSLVENDQRPWNNPYVILPFTSRTDLKVYRDQLANQVLRSFIKVDFQEQ